MDYITLKSEGKAHIIRIKLLKAVEVSDYLCKFHVKNEKPYSFAESLQKIQSILPKHFIRISRNCVINTQHVKSIDYKRREVILSGNMIFSFSVRNAKLLKQMFSR